MRIIRGCVSLVTIACANLLYGDPMLQVDFFQQGNDVVLSWNILNSGLNSGAEIFLQGYNMNCGHYEPEFIGWWRSTSYTITGTVDGGYEGEGILWDDHTPIKQPYPSYRWDYVFTPGVHQIHAGFFQEPGYTPMMIGPDGEFRPPSTTKWLEGTYTVYAVPDCGSIWLLLLSTGTLLATVRFCNRSRC